jgi:NADH-quinone oxidoreductase subunit J
MIYNILFYFFSALTIVTALMVVFASHPVKSALFLIFTFVNVAGLWMLAQSEFLSLALIFVYVGAVMTLLLFVVMMLNVPREVRFDIGKTIYTALNLLVGSLVIYILYYAAINISQPIQITPMASPTKAIGMVLYTDYALAFLITSMILLIGMIAAVSLCFEGRRSDRKAQVISEQLKANKASRLKFAPKKRQSK